MDRTERGRRRRRPAGARRGDRGCSRGHRIEQPAHGGDVVPKTNVDRPATERFPGFLGILLAQVNGDQSTPNRRLPARKRLRLRGFLGANLLPKVLQRPRCQVVGSFNPLAARGLGASSLSERTAKATEQIADNTKQLVREAQHGGLVFA